MFISICLFLIKWIYPFFEFFNEDLILKTVNESESDGYYYFPLIKYLSDLTFNLSFELGVDDLNLIPIPLGGILFHSLLLKITNNFFLTIFIIEFISLFLFLTIFYFLFRIVFKSQISIILSLIILFIPLLISLLNLDSFPYVSLLKNNLYNSRVPRPVVVNIYYFSLIYLIVNYDLKILFNKKIAIYFSFLSILLLTAFYYYFFIILILGIIVIIQNKNYVIKNFSKIKYLQLSSGIILLMPFLLILNFHEADFMERMGAIDLDLNNKKKLIKFYLEKFFEIKFIVILIANTILFYFLKKKDLANKLITVFYYLILSSLIAPLFFICISTKINIYYHFNNIIVIQNILFFIFSIFVLLKKQLNKFANFKVLTFFCLIFIILNIYDNSKNFKKIDNSRFDRIELIKSIQNNNRIQKNSNILTFDPKIMVWLILNDYKRIKVLNGNFTSKKNYMIEDDLIFSLQILNFNEIEFKHFIENKMRGWRYLNKDIQKFFFQRYMANSFYTYKNSQDFTNIEINKINKTSPFVVQQSIIPIFELNRLQQKFKNFSFNDENSKDLPNFLILNSNEFKKKDENKSFKYCKIFENNSYEIYELKLDKLIC